MKILVIAVMAVITLVIALALIQVLSGGSFDLLNGLFEWFRGVMP